MGPVIAFFLAALAIACGLLAVVAKPHWERHRKTSALDRHTSRSQGARS
ncbi:hypothetical protein [Brachybacterium nesterenkovii]